MKKILSIISTTCILLLSGLGVGASLIQEIPLKSTVILDEYDMVIISPEMFSDALQPLIDHKNSVGIHTFLKTTEEIYNEYNGRDYAEKIKYFIKDAIETGGVHYVFLTGNDQNVPMRKCAISVVTGQINWYEILSDLYYADVYNPNGDFSSWDSNNNGKYGECYFGFTKEDYEIIDDADLYPDVGVGRIPCSSIEECNNIVDKIIYYETSTYGNNWFNRIILMGGDTVPDSNSAYEGEWLHEKYIGPEMENHGFDLVKLYTSLDTFTQERITDEINSGAGFVNYAGHGYMNGFATYSPHGTSTIQYTINDLEELNNGYKLPVVFLDACLTGKLDYDIIDKIIIPLNLIFQNFFIHFLKRLLDTIETNKHFPCFASSLLNKHSGGCIAVIASTQPILLNLEYDDGEIIDINFGPSNLNIYFFESYEPGISLSNMFVDAQNRFIDRIKNSSMAVDLIALNEMNLFGDPSLKIGGYAEI